MTTLMTLIENAQCRSRQLHDKLQPLLDMAAEKCHKRSSLLNEIEHTIEHLLLPKLREQNEKLKVAYAEYGLTIDNLEIGMNLSDVKFTATSRQSKH